MKNQDYYIIGNVVFKRKDNALRFEREDGTKGLIPIKKVKSIFILGHAELDNEVFNLLGEEGILVHFYDFFSRYRGSFIPFSKKSSSPLLLKQVLAYEDLEKRLYLSKKTIMAASENIAKNIQYKLKFENKLDFIQKIKKHQESLSKADSIEEVMAVEGIIRKTYYEAIDEELISRGKEEFCMEKRVKRPPNNKMNALISFLNMCFYNTTLNSIHRTQLNPAIGYLHSTKTNRFSLSLDISEVLKPVVVDRIIFRLIFLGMLNDSCFNNLQGVCFLNEKGKKVVLQEYRSLLEKTFKCEKLNKTISYEYLVTLECYKLVKFFLEDSPYEPFVIER